jgi:hypothetical protein
MHSLIRIPLAAAEQRERIRRADGPLRALGLGRPIAERSRS